MLGHVYVVEDAKDLAQIVRDVTRYGGAYRPEVRAVGYSPFDLFLKLSRDDLGHIRVHPKKGRLEEDREGR